MRRHLLDGNTKAFVTLDGALLPVDRVAADRPYCSERKRRHGMDVRTSPDVRTAAVALAAVASSGGSNGRTPPMPPGLRHHVCAEVQMATR